MYLPGLLPIKLPAVAVRQLMEDADAGSNFNNSYIFIVCMYVCDSMYVCMYVCYLVFVFARRKVVGYLSSGSNCETPKWRGMYVMNVMYVMYVCDVCMYVRMYVCILFMYVSMYVYMYTCICKQNFRFE